MISPLLMKTKVGMADTLYLAATVWLCVCMYIIYGCEYVHVVVSNGESLC